MIFKESLYGRIPDEWDILPLKDLCDNPGGVQTGPFGSQLHQRDYVKKGTPIITVEHLGNNRITHVNLPRVSVEDQKRLARYTLKQGDIVFSRVGSVDRRSLVRDEEDGWLFSGRCLRVRPNTEKIDPRYLSWFFGLSNFQEYIRRIAVGATMPSLNTDLLENVEVIVPPLPEQRAIASILGALDDKIELNRQMNRTLEAVAQALFKSWFVDFDPVWAKKEGRQPFGMDADTAALFPDEFEESELGLIPAGWNVGCIGDIVASIRNSTDPSILDSGVPYIGLEHMPQQSIALDRWSKAATVKSLKLQFNRNDILFGKLRPYFHKVGIAPIDGVCSSDILVLRPKQPSYLGFALGFLSSTELIDYAAAISTGTRMPRVSWQDISAYPIVIPPLSTIQRFMLIAAPMLERLSHNIMESRILTEIRDTLLPKLLSGELRVPTATESVLSQEVTLHDA